MNIKEALENGNIEEFVIDNFNDMSLRQMKRLLVVLAGYADGIITERGVSSDDIEYIKEDIREAFEGV